MAILWFKSLCLRSHVPPLSGYLLVGGLLVRRVELTIRFVRDLRIKVFEFFFQTARVA